MKGFVKKVKYLLSGILWDFFYTLKRRTKFKCIKPPPQINARVRTYWHQLLSPEGCALFWAPLVFLYFQ